MSEVSATDGNTYQVQYFERAVFELHPELDAPNNVLLSLLGTQKYAAKYTNTAAVPTTSATATVATATAIVASVPATPGATATPVPTASATNTPIATATPTAPTPTVTATHMPTATATATPVTPPALVTAVPLPVATYFTSVPAAVKRGANATASVQTVSNAACSIAVMYKAGDNVAAAGLGDKTAPTRGLVSWTWTVGAQITPGTFPVSVTCVSDGRSATARTMIQITA